MTMATSLVRPVDTTTVTSLPPKMSPPAPSPEPVDLFPALTISDPIEDSASRTPSAKARPAYGSSRRKRPTILFYDPLDEPDSPEHDDDPNAADEPADVQYKNLLTGFFGPERSKQSEASAPDVKAEEITPVTLSTRAVIARIGPQKPKKEEQKTANAAQTTQPSPGKRRRRATKPVITPLPARWETKVESALKGANLAQAVANTTTGLPITRGDLISIVTPGRSSVSHTWLNDAAIDAYLQLVVDHGMSLTAAGATPRRRRGAPPKYHAFSTHFYSTLRERGPAAVKTWADKALLGGPRLLESECIFIPVHQGAHWTLLVLSPTQRTIEYFDSLGGRPAGFVAVAKRWLASELGDQYVEAEWRVLESRSPQQRNGFDCGVFLSTTAKMVVLGIEPECYGQADIQTQRRRMVAELINGGFRGDLAP